MTAAAGATIIAASLSPLFQADNRRLAVAFGTENGKHEIADSFHQWLADWFAEYAHKFLVAHRLYSKEQRIRENIMKKRVT